MYLFNNLEELHLHKADTLLISIMKPSCDVFLMYTTTHQDTFLSYDKLSRHVKTNQTGVARSCLGLPLNKENLTQNNGFLT